MLKKMQVYLKNICFYSNLSTKGGCFLSLCIFLYWWYECTCRLWDDDLDFLNRTVVIWEKTQRHLDSDGLVCCHDNAYTVQGYRWPLRGHRWGWNETEYGDDVRGRCFFFLHAAWRIRLQEEQKTKQKKSGHIISKGLSEYRAINVL